jgi:hypothetical protein
MSEDQKSRRFIGLEYVQLAPTLSVFREKNGTLNAVFKIVGLSGSLNVHRRIVLEVRRFEEDSPNHTDLGSGADSNGRRPPRSRHLLKQYLHKP